MLDAFTDAAVVADIWNGIDTVIHIIISGGNQVHVLLDTFSGSDIIKVNKSFIFSEVSSFIDKVLITKNLILTDIFNGSDSLIHIIVPILGTTKVKLLRGINKTNIIRKNISEKLLRRTTKTKV